MKVGILTYHKSHNYGALLQAIALRKVLCNLGHEASFIDYWPLYHKSQYWAIDPIVLKDYGLKSKISYILRAIFTLNKRNRRIKSFRKFIDINIEPYCTSSDSNYDAIIYGSDQIWRKQERNGNIFNPIYFGKNDFSRKGDIAYAASMGKIVLNESDRHDLKKWLDRFDALSVRENNLKEELEKSGIKDISVVSDPTILLDKSEWSKIFNLAPVIKDKYVLFYDLLPDSFDKQRIEEFAKERDLKLIVLKARIDNKKGRHNELEFENPEGMMTLIANAEHIFTSSYHGLVISLIFNKSVTAAFSANRGRAESLVKYLNIPQILLATPTDELKDYIINYSKVNKLLSSQKDFSIQFLKNSLNLTKFAN